MTEQDDIHIQPVNFVAQGLGITARRLRQFVENGDIPRLGRGLVDFTCSTYFYSGSLIVEDWRTKPSDPKTLYAIAWLTGLGAEPTATDLEACAATFRRNGFSRDDALLAIGRAQGVMRNV